MRTKEEIKAEIERLSQDECYFGYWDDYDFEHSEDKCEKTLTDFVNWLVGNND